jgi:alkylation response protein AidB-like acyl-CoA dehydrogenase
MQTPVVKKLLESGKGINLASPIDIVSRAKAVAPLIDSESDAIEAAGTLTPKIVEALRKGEFFWMLVPKELNGGGVSLPTAIEVIEELSRADGSTGWAVMATSVATSYAAGWCGDAAITEMFLGADRAIVAGMPAPVGRAQQLENGYRGGGKYKFGSGSGFATWIAAGVAIYEDGAPKLQANGEPATVTFFLSKEKVEMNGNWNVFGLQGTGSYDYEVKEQFVRSDFAVNVRSLEPLRGKPLYLVGGLTLNSACHAAFAMGVSRRALQELVANVATKTRAGYSSSISNFQVFRHEFARHEAMYQSARAYLLQVYRDLQATVDNGDLTTLEQRIRCAQANLWVHAVAADVVRLCHVWSGSIGLRNPSKIGRCMRDIYTATNHLVVDPIKWQDVFQPIFDSWAN